MASTLLGSKLATRRVNRTRRGKSDTPAATSVMYDAQVEDWEKICDLLEGTETMREAGPLYLPKEPAESDKAYRTRLDRSHLYNGVEGAISKAVSYPFRQKVAVTEQDENAEDVGEYVDDVDGSKCTLTQFAAAFFEAMVALGHAFVFVDWTEQPKAAAGKVVSKAEEEAAGARGKWRIIKATDMLAWQIDPKTHKPTEIRWREVRLERQAGKKWLDEEREYVRVWRADGTWEIWRAKTALQPEETILGTYLGTRPVDCSVWWSGNFKQHAKGTHNYPDGIPVAVAYAKQTGDFTSIPPFKELAGTNIEHWQSSSDQRNILRFARLAQKVISGATAKDLEAKNQVHSVHNVMSLKDPNAKAYFLEHSGAAIASGEADLNRLESRMEGQGLQPLTTRTVEATATESMIDLKNISTDEQWWITQAEMALTQAVDMTYRWQGKEKPKEMMVQIYRDFDVPVAGGKDFDYVERMKDNGEIRTVTKLKEAQRRNILTQTLDVEREVEEASMEAPGIAPDKMAAGDWTLLPGEEADHGHEATLDDQGNGESTPSEGHTHQIQGATCLPGGDDGHVHEMEQITADAPAEDLEVGEADPGDEEDPQKKPAPGFPPKPAAKPGAKPPMFKPKGKA